MENWKFNGTDDVMDSRDIIERIAELADKETANDVLTEDEKAELGELTRLAGQCEDCSDWGYAEALIHDDYFTTYTQELVTDCCPEVSKALEASSWPMTCLKMDWEKAARDLQVDYMPVEFAGSTYWIRSV